jgi:hypothetical protein
MDLTQSKKYKSDMARLMKMSKLDYQLYAHRYGVEDNKDKFVRIVYYYKKLHNNDSISNSVFPYLEGYYQEIVKTSIAKAMSYIDFYRHKSGVNINSAHLVGVLIPEYGFLLPPPKEDFQLTSFDTQMNEVCPQFEIYPHVPIEYSYTDAEQAELDKLV